MGNNHNLGELVFKMSQSRREKGILLSSLEKN